LKRDSIRPLLSAALLAAATCIAASPAAAQSIAQPGTWSVTPFLGSSTGIGLPNLDVLDPLIDNSVGLGVTVSYDLTSNLGFEGEVAHLFDVAGDTDVIDWAVSNFSANAVYHFNARHVTPYATFGLGVERSAFDDRAPDRLDLDLDASATEIAINFGGGVKYPINSRFIARGDIRRFQANDLAPDYWRLYGGVSWLVKQ
jgi:hypothetical protein